MPISDPQSSPASRPLFIVMNAGSGGKDAEDREGVIREVVSAAGRPLRLWLTDSAKIPAVAREAVQMAQREDGVVVAAGGDGTINAVAQQVLAAGCPFGVVPQGTFNYFSRAHGIPLDTRDAATVLLQGVIRPVQVGLVNERLFLVNASVGLYPKLLEKREAHKEKFGRTRGVAMASALVTLLSAPPQLVLKMEEGDEVRVEHISTLLVENNVLQLQEVGLEEEQAVRKGELAAIVVKAKGVLQMLGVVAQAARGRLGESKSVVSFPFTNLTVTPLHRRRIKVATDGEVTWLMAPLEFRVAPRPLLLMVPPPGTKAPAP